MIELGHWSKKLLQNLKVQQQDDQLSNISIIKNNTSLKNDKKRYSDSNIRERKVAQIKLTVYELQCQFLARCNQIDSNRF